MVAPKSISRPRYFKGSSKYTLPSVLYKEINLPFAASYFLFSKNLAYLLCFFSFLEGLWASGVLEVAVVTAVLSAAGFFLSAIAVCDWKAPTTAIAAPKKRGMKFFFIV